MHVWFPPVAYPITFSNLLRTSTFFPPMPCCLRSCCLRSCCLRPCCPRSCLRSCCLRSSCLRSCCLRSLRCVCGVGEEGDLRAIDSHTSFSNNKRTLRCRWTPVTIFFLSLSRIEQMNSGWFIYQRRTNVAMHSFSSLRYLRGILAMHLFFSFHARIFLMIWTRARSANTHTHVQVHTQLVLTTYKYIYNLF